MDFTIRIRRRNGRIVLWAEINGHRWEAYDLTTGRKPETARDLRVIEGGKQRPERNGGERDDGAKRE